MTPEFECQPTLRGEHLLVRPLQPGDWEALFAAAADPQLWAQHPSSDRYLEPVFREFFDDALATGSAFAIIDLLTDRIVGSSRYNGLDVRNSEVEIGWTFLSRDYWGGGYNAELKALMLDHAFRFVDTVVFWVGVSNKRSRRAVEKIGGVLREGTVRRGEGSDNRHVIYELRRPSTEQ